MNAFDANGWYTKAVNYANGTYRSPNFGYPTGAHGNKGRKAVVLHVTDGNDSRGWLCNPAAQVSAHFLVREEGVYQFVSIFDSTWANGIWEDKHKYRGVPDAENPNKYTVSIEREGRPKIAMSAHMDDLTVMLLSDLQVPFPQFSPYLPDMVNGNLIGHFAISPYHRPNCPGPTVDFAKLADRANGLAPAADWWALWGDTTPLDPTTRTWAIPQTWYQQAQQLGAAQSGEVWNTSGDACIQWFIGGYIVYDKRTDKANTTLRG